VFSQWHLVALPALFAVAALAAYVVGVRRIAARGGSWSLLRTLTFAVLGIGSYVLVTLGFLGVYSPFLRWAFAAEAALLLLVVPALIALGRPIELARKVLPPNARERLDQVLHARLVRLLSTPIGGPALLLFVLLLFLTPLPPAVRTHAAALAVAQILLPLLGLLALVPVASGEEPASSATMAIGFLIAFVELIADALPGILLRLHNTIIGPVSTLASSPRWLPSPLRDQQLSGDVLWFLGEAIDLPFLAWLVIRWIRADQREAAVVDARLDAAEHDDRPWWEIEADARRADSTDEN
jgi:putative membrane protein